MSTHTPRSLTIGWAIAFTALGVVMTHSGIALAAGLRVFITGAGYEQTIAEVARDPLSLALAPAFGLGVACWVGVVRHFPNQSVGAAVGFRPISGTMVALALLTGSALQFPLSELGNLLREVWPIPIEQQIALSKRRLGL